MSICARGIIFGIELVSFLAVCVIMLCKHYKRDKKFIGVDYAKAMRNENIGLYSILYAIVFALFLFSYQTLPFLSYDKMLMVGLFVIFFSTIIVSLYHFGTKKEKNAFLFFVVISVLCLIIFALMTSKLIYFGS